MDFGEPTKLHYGKQVAAALAFIGLAYDDRVVLDTFSLDPGRGDEQRPGPLADVSRGRLPRPAPGPQRERPHRRRQGVRHQARRQGRHHHHLRLPRQAGLRAGAPLPPARNMDIYVVQVLAREEVEPELVGDLRLVDAEDDDIAEITVSAPCSAATRTT